MRPAQPALAAGVVVVLASAVGTAVATGAEYGEGRSLWLLGWFAGSGLLVVGTRALSEKRAVALGFALLLVTAAIALHAGPRSSTDLYRYVWDGIVQTHGHDPYRLPPDAPDLNSLKPHWLFPSTTSTLINRPEVRTIYPPAAQLWFTVLALLTPVGVHTGVVRLGALVACVLAGHLTVKLLRAAGQDPRWALLWLASPVAAWEAAGNGHVDVVAVVLVLLGLAAVREGRMKRAGVVTALAFAVKFFPAGALVAGVRRKPLAFLASSAAVVLGLYLPHLLAVGTKAIGFLPDYVSDEGFNGTTKYPALRVFLPDHVAEVAAPLLLVAVVVVALVRADPDEPWTAGLWVTGAGVLLVGSTYPWYGTVLLALVVVSRRWEWMAAVVAPYVWNVGHDDIWLQAAFAAATVVCLVGEGVRARPVRRGVRPREHVDR